MSIEPDVHRSVTRSSMSRWLPIAAAVSTLVVTPRLSGAQDKRLTARLEPETAALVTQLVDSVRAAGLPSDPLVGVALQGASRRASNDQILAAVREYATALGSARQALGHSAGSDEIVSAAGVIVSGIAPSTVAEYRAARPSGSLTVPLVMLVDLVARGVPSDVVTSALGDALRGGARDAELTEMRRRVLGDILAGANPTIAMFTRTRALPKMQPGSVTPTRTKSPRLRRPGPR